MTLMPRWWTRPYPVGRTLVLVIAAMGVLTTPACYELSKAEPPTGEGLRYENCSAWCIQAQLCEFLDKRCWREICLPVRDWACLSWPEEQLDRLLRCVGMTMCLDSFAYQDCVGETMLPTCNSDGGAPACGARGAPCRDDSDCCKLGEPSDALYCSLGGMCEPCVTGEDSQADHCPSAKCCPGWKCIFFPSGEHTCIRASTK